MLAGISRISSVYPINLAFLKCKNKHVVMGKKRELTLGSGRHGVASSKTHRDDQLAFKRREAEKRKKRFQAYEVGDADTYAPFNSDVSAIGQGRNWIIRKGRRFWELGGEAWVELMMRMGRQRVGYHQRQVRKGVVGYYWRKVRDRSVLGPTDKTHRPLTDVARETIDLRPDHSRALSKILKVPKHAAKLESALAAIRNEKLRLFEEIYHRQVLGVGEHPDSGQFHHDLWHSGIRSAVVEDLGAEKKNGKFHGGSKMKVRERTPYRSYGVSVGVASWDRHRSALTDHGLEPGKVMGPTLEILQRNEAKVHERYGEPARDLRMLRELDSLVDRILRAIDPDLCDEARGEYIDWIQAGYEQGKLGVKPMVAKKMKLEAEVAELDKQANEAKSHHAKKEKELKGRERDLDKREKQINQSTEKMFARKASLEKLRKHLIEQDKKLKENERRLKANEAAAKNDQVELKALRIEVIGLRKTAELYGRLVEWVKKMLLLPHVGVFMKRAKDFWPKFAKEALEFGIEGEVGVIQKIKDQRPGNGDSGVNKPDVE